MEIQVPRYRQLARNYSAFFVSLLLFFPSALTNHSQVEVDVDVDSPRKSSNVELHVKFTIVLPSPAAQRSRPRASALMSPVYVSTPHLVGPVAQSNPLVNRLESEAQSRCTIVLSYYRP